MLSQEAPSLHDALAAATTVSRFSSSISSDAISSASPPPPGMHRHTHYSLAPYSRASSPACLLLRLRLRLSVLCLATCPLLANLSRHSSFAIPPVSRLRRYLPPVLMRTLRSTTTGTAHSNQARQGDPHLSSNPHLSSDVSLSFDTCLSCERGRTSPTQRSVVRLTRGALLLIL